MPRLRSGLTPTPSATIGTLNEGHLHASLKLRYLEPGDATEAKVDGYIVDIHRDGLIIEIQTRNFSSIARKMRDLVSRHRVRLVHPLPGDLWILNAPQDEGGEITRRKSPKHLHAIDVFEELVSIPDLIGHPNFQLDLVLTQEERLQRFEGGRKAWRRRGWVTVERRLLAIDRTISLQHLDDYAALIPPGLPAQFLTSDLATAIKRPRAVAQKVAYCLRHAGCIEQVGARGNAILYARSVPVVDPASHPAHTPRRNARRGAAEAPS